MSAIFFTGSSGHVSFSGIIPGKHVLRIIAQNSRQDRMVVRRFFAAPSNLTGCSPYLINDGVTVQGNGSARVEFAAIGQPSKSFLCRLDQQTTVPCEFTTLGFKSITIVNRVLFSVCVYSITIASHCII